MCEIDGKSLRSKRVFTLMHWALVVSIFLMAAWFVVAMASGCGSIDVYGYLTGSDVDGLVGIAAAMGVILIFDRIIRSLRFGNPPFAEDHAYAFLLMAAIMVVRTVVSVLIQLSFFFMDSSIEYGIRISLDPLIAGVVFFVLYVVFKYGSTLQAEVQDLV